MLSMLPRISVLRHVLLSDLMCLTIATLCWWDWCWRYVVALPRSAM